MTSIQITELKEADPHLNHLYNVVGGVVMFQALRVVNSLGIADLLKDGPRSVMDLAKETNSHAGSLYRVLRAVANMGIFTELADHAFEQNSVSHFLRKDVPFSMKGFVNLDLLDNWLRDTIHNLPYTTQTGKPAFEHAHGMNMWDYLKTHTHIAQIFNEHMTDISNAYNEIIHNYDFSRANVVTDLGGAHCSLLKSVLIKNVHLQGVLFDLPDVISDAKPYFTDSPLQSRCRLEAGSFFDSVPSDSDIYILRYILHDWDDESCMKILKNCRSASPDAKVLLVERVLKPHGNPQFTLVLDLWMAMLFDDAKERTELEYKSLLERSGYKLNRLISTNSPFSIVEAVPV